MDLTIKVDEEYIGYQNFIRNVMDRLGDEFGPEVGINNSTLFSIDTRLNTSTNRLLLKTLWEKQKLLVTSNFSFSHSFFYSITELYSHLSVPLTSYFYLPLNWNSPELAYEVKGYIRETNGIRITIKLNNHSLAISARFSKFESKTASDWLNCMVLPIRSCVTYKCF